VERAERIPVRVGALVDLDRLGRARRVQRGPQVEGRERRRLALQVREQLVGPRAHGVVATQRHPVGVDRLLVRRHRQVEADAAAGQRLLRATQVVGDARELGGAEGPAPPVVGEQRLARVGTLVVEQPAVGAQHHVRMRGLVEQRHVQPRTVVHQRRAQAEVVVEPALELLQPQQGVRRERLGPPVLLQARGREAGMVEEHERHRQQREEHQRGQQPVQCGERGARHQNRK
jgi:hypothetical protein